jgi:hypothetical protein
MPAPLPPLVKAERELERLKLDNARLRSINKKLLRRGGGYDEFIDEFKQILEEDTKFSFKTRNNVRLIQPHEPNHEEIAVAACSDLHLTENVRVDDANGINIYNSVIAANRLWEHRCKLLSILARHMAMYKLKYLWVPILGDMINGTIHPEQVYTNDLTDPAAVVLGARLLYMFIQELKGLGLPIQIDCIHGNHPRLTHKMPTKKQAHTNLDWLMYEYLADKIDRDDQVQMTVHTGQMASRKLYDWTYRFEHGIDVKSGGEENFEDRVRAIFDDPTYRQATGATGPSFDQIVVGNMHKPKFLERTIVNGSYIGQNELGQSWRLKPIRAQQLCWGISKKHVRTWNYAIDLTHVRSDKATNPFSEYTAWFLKRHGNR